jgi:diacylglycerol O-acyltransferase
VKHLSGLDNLFLTLDQGNQYMHVGGVGVYDPSSAPGGKVRFKSILNFFANRLNQAKIFRRRLVMAPLGLDRPYWIEDGEIDIEYHVRHIALPHPGDWRQLMIQVARIHSRPLDMTKPLWEAYIIEGLNNIPGISPDSFAMYTKFHHSAVDGEAGAELIRAIHTLTPELDEASGGTDGAAMTIVADREPTAAELYARAVGNRTQQALQATKLFASLGGRLASAGGEFIVSGKALELGRHYAARWLGREVSSPDESEQARSSTGIKPHTRFDGEVTAHRVVEAVGFPLADCKKIRQHIAGATINDIFMAAVGGALRNYLEGKNELPERSLNAMVPMTTRGQDKGIDAGTDSGIDSGNHIGMTALPLRTDIADPLERLRAVSRGNNKGKAVSAALGKDLPAQLVNVLPASLAAKLLVSGLTSLANVTVSNVRGPDVPLYMAGAQLQLFLPVSIPMTGLGLNITGFSYNGTLWVCFVSCRQMIADPGVFAQCLNEAFEELVGAAVATGPRAGTYAAAAKAHQVSATSKRAPVKRKAKRSKPSGAT